MRNILITGCAGFIGASLVKKLLNENKFLIGIDNLNDYYDPSLKISRLNDIKSHCNKHLDNWIFKKISLENKERLAQVFKEYEPDVVINLAAQAGVRYSLENPEAYVQSNLVGFFNLLELSKEYKVKNFIFASSSSVYGNNKLTPFSEDHFVDQPISFYAATKKSNELMAYTYSHLYKIPTIGLRFFTVYGPWGRPDMAPMIFAKAILNRKPIKVFNYGKMERDFTYIDDIVEGIYRCIFKPAFINKTQIESDINNNDAQAPYRIFNIGNNKPVKLLKFIEILENCFGRKAEKIFEPIQKGDVQSTFANTKKLYDWVGYQPNTQIEEGLNSFARWYKNYYFDK